MGVSSVRSAIQRAYLEGPGAEAARAYALDHLVEIVACMTQNGIAECDSVDVMMNGRDLMELYPDDGRAGDDYPVIGVGCSVHAGFGGLGVHYRTAPRVGCDVQ